MGCVHAQRRGMQVMGCLAQAEGKAFVSAECSGRKMWWITKGGWCLKLQLKAEHTQLLGILLKATVCRITLKLKAEHLFFLEFVAFDLCQPQFCSSGKVWGETPHLRGQWAFQEQCSRLLGLQETLPSCRHTSKPGGYSWQNWALKVGSYSLYVVNNM